MIAPTRPVSWSQIGAADSSPRYGRRADRVAQLVADEDGLQRDRGLGALIGGDFAVQRGNDFLGGGLRVLQVGKILEHFERRPPARAFRPFGGAEFPQNRSCSETSLAW